MELQPRLRAVWPGVALSGVLAAAAVGLQALELRLLGQPILEALVLAILLGTAFRTIFGDAASTRAGRDFCARPVLEFAVVLLGGTMNLRALLAGGPRLLVGVALSTLLSLAVGAFLSRRLFGLGRNQSTLIAVGNAICGNSAIAAIAPLIGASAAEVCGAIAFTAVLGVVLVIALPLLILPLLHFTHSQYGVLVGMTVYAVPQVLAASFPVSELSGQTATLVKLTRVLLLGPVAIYYSLSRRKLLADRLRLGQLVPWFILGFLVLGGFRTAGVISTPISDFLKDLARILTVVAMAALGLGVDVRALRNAGLKTTGAVLVSLAFLLILSTVLIGVLHLG